MCTGSTRPPSRYSIHYWTRGEGRLLVVITGRPGGWLPAGWPVKVFDLEPLTDEQADS